MARLLNRGESGGRGERGGGGHSGTGSSSGCSGMFLKCQDKMKMGEYLELYFGVVNGLLLGEAWLLVNGVLFKLENGLPPLLLTFSCFEVFLCVVDSFLLTSFSTDLKLSCLSTPAVGILST